MIPLELYAAITAELGEKREPRARTLQRHGLDDDDWTIEERAWTTAIAAASADDDGALLVEFARLLGAARDNLAFDPASAATLALEP